MATTSRGGKAYVWVTWITGMLAGDKECGYAPWFRAHFRYEKLSDRSFDLAAWNADHTALVAKRRAELEDDGWVVTLEGANQFRLAGKTAILSGKPDIVARRGSQVLVVDCKTGKQRHSDWWQVLVYLMALPRCFDDFRAAVLRGEVCYRDTSIDIEPEELNAARREQIYAALRQIGDEARPPTVPSARECEFCDISATDCAARYLKVGTEPEAVMASEF